jgi:hypothetical protein
MSAPIWKANPQTQGRFPFPILALFGCGCFRVPRGTCGAGPATLR